MSDGLRERIRSDLNAARRERDKLRTVVLTTILSDIKNREIELGREVADADVIEVVNRSIKRRREAAEQMRTGRRTDLADKEDSEAALLAVYLPAQLSEDEVRQLVRAAISSGANNVGAVMNQVMPRLKGAFDGKAANKIVQEELQKKA